MDLKNEMNKMNKKRNIITQYDNNRIITIIFEIKNLGNKKLRKREILWRKKRKWNSVISLSHSVLYIDNYCNYCDYCCL